MKDFVADWDALRAADPEVADAIAGELERERTTLRLIASENYASPAVLAAIGSTMNNKYAEGYPGRRYYGGCEFVDVTEQLAIDRAKELFGADHANVQPHAGAQANMAVFGAFLEPRSDDKVLGLVLAHGGHLTHGSPVNVSGMWFNFVGYEVDRDTEQLDMDHIRDLAVEQQPKIILAGYTAYPRAIDFAAFRQIADEVGALLWVDASHFIGLVRGRCVPQPRPARRRRDVHHAQDPARSRGRDHRLPAGARQGDRQGRVPDDAGRAAGARDRREGRGAQGGDGPRLRRLRGPNGANGARPRAGARRRGAADHLGGTDSHLVLADLRPLGISGKGRRRPWATRSGSPSTRTASRSIPCRR